MVKKKLGNSTKKFENNNQINIFIGIILGLLMIFSILTLLPQEKNNNGFTVSAAIESREEKSPNEYEDITYTTASSALSEANNQLMNMELGNIFTIDGNHQDFVGRFFLDNKMGGIKYWELTDPETIIYIDACSGEILYYDHTGWVDGSLSQTEIEIQAEEIAVQFEDLPEDAEEPESELIELYTAEGINPETMETSSTETFSYWIVQYNRTKDLSEGSGTRGEVKIDTEDYIRLLLCKNGDLHTYIKIWNMDIGELDTTYTVSMSEAIYTALSDAGENSEEQYTYKRIVRPNYSWTSEEGFLFGEDPVCVWVVWVEDSDKDLRVYHIHYTENTIIGGFFVSAYYVDD